MNPSTDPPSAKKLNNPSPALPGQELSLHPDTLATWRTFEPWRKRTPDVVAMVEGAMLEAARAEKERIFRAYKVRPLQPDERTTEGVSDGEGDVRADLRGVARFFENTVIKNSDTAQQLAECIASSSDHGKQHALAIQHAVLTRDLSQNYAQTAIELARFDANTTRTLAAIDADARVKIELARINADLELKKSEELTKIEISRELAAAAAKKAEALR